MTFVGLAALLSSMCNPAWMSFCYDEVNTLFSCVLSPPIYNSYQWPSFPSNYKQINFICSCCKPKCLKIQEYFFPMGSFIIVVIKATSMTLTQLREAVEDRRARMLWSIKGSGGVGH